MKPTLFLRLPMIPRLTASAGKAECLAHEHVGWELLEVDDTTEAILICKPCAATWAHFAHIIWRSSSSLAAERD